MDNITHTLVGAVLAQTGLKRWTPLATTTLLLSANFPDIDVLAGVNTLAYLEHHRGLTHAVAALPLLALLLAGVIYGSARWRRPPDALPVRFGPLFVLALMGMATHPLLDFTNSYGWRPFLPWSQHWYYGDIAFVVDPWLWAGLGGTLMWVTATTQARLTAWRSFFAVLAVPVLFVNRTSWGVRTGWLVLVALFIAGQMFFQFTSDTARRIMGGVILAVLIYFGLLTWLQQEAVRRVQTIAPLLIAAGEEMRQVDALPLPANPLWWRMVIATEQAFYFVDLPPLWLTAPSFSTPRPVRYERASGDTTAIAAALREPEFQAFLRFARFPVLAANRQPDQTIEVEINDARFYGLAARSNTFRFVLHFDAQLRRLVE